MNVARFRYRFAPLRHHFARPQASVGRVKTSSCRSVRAFQGSYRSPNIEGRSHSAKLIPIRKSARWWKQYSDVLFTGKTWIFLLVVYCISELGQGYYIGYYKELNWLSHNQYARLFSDDDDQESQKNAESMDDDRETKPNDRGYLALAKPHQIRVLKLKPGAGNEQLEIELEHVDTSAKPNYIALSYVWGTDRDKDAIRLNGRRVSIGKNLSDALRRLRSPDATATLWVDALCIDQHNDDEKASQVRLMADIYSQANAVLIWLGNDEAIEAGIKSLRDRKPDKNYIDWSPLEPIFTNPLYYTAQRFLVWLGLHSVDRAGVAKLQPHQYSGQFDWADLIPVIRAPWFSRIWCIQELVMAKNPVIVTKKSSISWERFAKAVTELNADLDLYKMKNPELETLSFENLYILHNLRTQYKKRRREKHNLLELMSLTRGFNATDPRDKLFALLGLAGDVLATDWEIMPDYSLPLNEVYHRFALWYVARKRNVNLFSFGQKGDGAASNDPNAMPSWVPDLRRPHTVALLPKLEYLSDNYIDIRYEVAKEFQLRKDYFKNATKIYHADLKYPWWGLGRTAKFSPTFVAFSNGKRTLEVVGTRIGTIKTLGRPFGIHGLEGPLVCVHTYYWMCANWSMIARAKARIAGVEYLEPATHDLEVAWRTMTCNMTPKGHSAQPTIFSRAARLIYDDYLDAQRDLWQQAKTGTGKDVVVSNAKQRLWSAFRQTTSAQSGMEAFLLMHMSINKWMSGRRLAMCDDGMITAAPAETAIDDIICIFNGGRVPYVLRPLKNGQYSLVGECYVDGMMRGEVKDKFPRRKHEKKFSIA